MLRSTPGSGKPQRLYLSGVLDPKDDGLVYLEYQASEAQRPPLKAFVEQCNVSYEHSKGDVGKIYMCRKSLSSKDADMNKRTTIKFPKILEKTPIEIAAMFDTGVVGAGKVFKDMRVKPSLVYDDNESIFKLYLPGYTMLTQDEQFAPAVPFLMALGMASTLETGYEVMNLSFRPNLIKSNFIFPKNQTIGTTIKGFMLRALVSDDPEVETLDFDENCEIDLIFTEERLNKYADYKINLDDLYAKENQVVQAKLNRAIETLLNALNLPEEVVEVDDSGVLARKNANVGSVRVYMSQNLAQLLDANSSSAVIKLHSKQGVGGSIEFGYFKGSRVAKLSSLFPLTLIGSGLSTSSMTYVQGFGYTNVVCVMSTSSSVSSSNEFVLTSSRGYLSFKLVDSNMQPADIGFSMRVNMLVTLRDAELTPSM